MVAYTSIQHGDESASRRRIHWHVPATIFAALLLGLLIAICHHCIYQALSGKVVSSDTQQRWIIRGGTALAFLFTMFLTVATGSAYIQQLWLSLSKRPFKIAQLDDMFEVLKDATGFIDIMLWLRNPLLALLAIITWSVKQSCFRCTLADLLQGDSYQRCHHTWYFDSPASSSYSNSRPPGPDTQYGR